MLQAVHETTQKPFCFCAKPPKKIPSPLRIAYEVNRLNRIFAWENSHAVFSKHKGTESTELVSLLFSIFESFSNPIYGANLWGLDKLRFFQIEYHINTRRTVF